MIYIRFFFIHMAVDLRLLSHEPTMFYTNMAIH